MAGSQVTTGRPKKGTIERIKNPRRLQVIIEADTYKRLKHIAIDRDLTGVSVLVEEALQFWLKAQTAEKTKS